MKLCQRCRQRDCNGACFAELSPQENGEETPDEMVYVSRRLPGIHDKTDRLVAIQHG